MISSATLDLAVIGGGIAGIIHLHYARRAGLRTLLLEKAPAVGGLWRTLPAWQDIQICPVDWTVGDLPIEGPMQAQVLANIESWVTRFDLAPDIRTGCPVHQARHDGESWVLETAQGAVRARHLVAATGAHNRPWIPTVAQRDGSVAETHSSALRDPTELAGARVLVVGGGASALDLLDQCLLQGAAHTVWAHRDLRWFTPTSKPKAVAGSVRPVARMQAQGVPVEQQNALVRADLVKRYQHFGLQALLPDRPLDLRTDQLFPGRARMLAGLAQITRHRGDVQALVNGQAHLSDGSVHTIDRVLWGTGYRTDLSYFANPQLAAVTGVNELAGRCGCGVRSLDEPDLYFPAVGLEGFGATSWNFAVMARSIVSHITGHAKLDLEPLPYRLNHLEMVRHLATRDPASFGGVDPDAFCRDIGLGTPDDQPYPMP
jgi:cation diffusion facilitator CzcD-associated flavoprotein CzcO